MYEIQPAVIESMSKWKTLKFVVRVWRNERLVSKTYKQPDVEMTINRNFSITDPSELAMEILQLPTVNAVEVVDFEGSGIVLYRDWP